MTYFIRKSRLQNGFTLIELLFVITLISIIASVALALLGESRNKALVARAVTDLKQMELAINLYVHNHPFNLIPCFDHTWDDGVGDAAGREGTLLVNYIKWPLNPWGYEYHWEHTPYGPNTEPEYTISVRSPGPQNALALDKILDNGDLSTGRVTGDANGDRLEYEIELTMSPMFEYQGCFTA